MGKEREVKGKQTSLVGECPPYSKSSSNIFAHQVPSTFSKAGLLFVFEMLSCSPLALASFFFFVRRRVSSFHKFGRVFSFFFSSTSFLYLFFCSLIFFSSFFFSYFVQKQYPKTQQNKREEKCIIKERGNKIEKVRSWSSTPHFQIPQHKSLGDAVHPKENRNIERIVMVKTDK